MVIKEDSSSCWREEARVGRWTQSSGWRIWRSLPLGTIITANSKMAYPEALLSARKGMAEGGGVTISWPDKPADCRIIESGLEQAEIHPGHAP